MASLPSRSASDARKIAERIKARGDAATAVSAEKFNTLLADAQALAGFVLEGGDEARTS